MLGAMPDLTSDSAHRFVWTSNFFAVATYSSTSKKRKIIMNKNIFLVYLFLHFIICGLKMIVSNAIFVFTFFWYYAQIYFWASHFPNLSETRSFDFERSSFCFFLLSVALCLLNKNNILHSQRSWKLASKLFFVELQTFFDEWNQIQSNYTKKLKVIINGNYPLFVHFHTLSFVS